MYLTVKNQLRNYSVREYEILRKLCRLSKNLYNEALYSVRKYFFAERKYLRYENNYYVCKTSENYRALNTDIAQQTLKVVDRCFKSFFALISKAKSGSYQFNQISLPHYLDKEGYFSLIIPRINIKNGYFTLPMSREFKREHEELRFIIPPNIADKEIQEVRIHPRNNARFFEIEYIYIQPEISVNLDYDKYLAVDLGLDNLASCVTSEGASFIIDGKQIKSYNRLYNKENAKLQSILAKQQIKYFSKRQYLNLQKRNARINYAMSVAARKIISYCIDNHIGNIVVGYNPYWKRNINIGSHNNQNFVQIPHGLMREKLNYLCELYGIKYYEQEESYTSKASFFDNDKLPVYNADNPQSYTFSGKRITRGQYMTSTCYILNADINGALNILRKCNLISLKALQDRGCVNQPQRIRVF
ncbi:MAG: transposase [Synergistaceae bacterium]|nr:transposase [Synergistaceae bacterium]